MTIAEELRAQGLEKGRAEGLAVAEQMLEKLLTLKFGEPSADLQARIASATLADLQTWADRVLRAATLDEVFAD